MALTKVTLEGMRSALGAMENTVATSRTNLNNTGASIRGLSSTWTGTSAGQFQTAEQAWETNCGQILKAMEELMQSMETAANDYKNTEELNTDQATLLQQQFGAMSLA